MFSTANADRWLAQPFAPVSLAQLNARAAMLERLDQKYVVRAGMLARAMPELARHFDILQIDGRRAFLYETRYFDDAQLGCYFDHQRGRRQRLKVRVRRYTDTAQCFVEVKLKHRRGITVKKRLPYETEKYGVLDARAVEHVETSHRELYGIGFGRPLAPALDMSYRRMTLVAKDGGERMTIDYDICFVGEQQARRTGGDVFIVEAKSANGNGVADRILRALHQHPTWCCSKYCVGLSLVGAVDKYNRFRPALRKLGALDAIAMVLPSSGR